MSKFCGRCKGSGKLPVYNHVQGGVCFTCMGTGDIELGKEIKAQHNRIPKQSREDAIKGLKEGIGSLYNQLTNPPTKIGKLPAIQKERRRVLVDYVNELANEYGIFVRTKEDFEELGRFAKENEDVWF